jgi:hypothetical protein
VLYDTLYTLRVRSSEPFDRRSINPLLLDWKGLSYGSKPILLAVILICTDPGYNHSYNHSYSFQRIILFLRTLVDFILLPFRIP